jgi:Leucine-rich repeat (LRR) protein
LKEDLRRSLKLTREVAIAVTDRVVSPVVVGLLKPIILLPAALLTGYTPEQVKMLLVHELAHVRRWDAAINLGQRLVEALLFFHPMVWVVSQWVHEEREHCCDAIVVEQTGDPEGYATTLALLAKALPQALPMPALAAARHPVVRRIRQILNGDDHGLPLPGGILAVIAALMLVGLVLPRLWAGVSGALDTQEGGPMESGMNKAQGDAASNMSRPAKPGKERTFHFPADRSFGNLYVQDPPPGTAPEYHLDYRSSIRWQPFGPARGTVVVPAGKQVRLTISKAAALRDLSPLDSVEPNALEDLAIYGWEAGELQADEAILPHLRHLTGLKSLALEQVKVTERGLANLQPLTALRHLTLRAPQLPPGQASTFTGLTDNCLEQLAGLSSLETLVLSSAEITDAGLAYLAKLPHLRELELWSAKIQGAGLAHLERVSRLRFLRLGGPASSDAAVEPISRLKSLRSLHLDASPLTDAGLAHMSHLGELEELSFACRGLTTQGVAALKSLTRLKGLEINQVEISRSDSGDHSLGDTVAAQLQAISSMERLRLNQFELTDAGLKSLAKLAKLKSLRVVGVFDPESVTNRITYTETGLEVLSHLNELEELELSLYGPGINETALAQLAKLKQLKQLSLYAPKVTNTDLVPVSSLKALKQLFLYVPEVTISGLNALNSLTNLRQLTLTGIRQDNGGLNLSRLTQLEEFRLMTRQVYEGGAVKTDNLRDADLAWLTGLKRLRWLQGLCGVSDAGMKYLTNLTSLEGLTIHTVQVTDAGLANLSLLRNLQTLHYQGPITDEGLRHLEGLRSLNFLTIVDLEKQVSPAALERLRQRLPDLQIMSGGMGMGAGGG